MPTKINRSLNTSATAHLTRAEYVRFCQLAHQRGTTPSELLRRLILDDLAPVSESILLQTIDAEYTRSIICAAQRGQALTPELLKALRNDAILKADIIAENTLRLVRQQSRLPVPAEGRVDSQGEERDPQVSLRSSLIP